MGWRLHRRDGRWVLRWRGDDGRRHQHRLPTGVRTRAAAERYAGAVLQPGAAPGRQRLRLVSTRRPRQQGAKFAWYAGRRRMLRELLRELEPWRWAELSVEMPPDGHRIRLFKDRAVFADDFADEFVF